MGSPLIWFGNKAKLLKATLNFNGNSDIAISGSASNGQLLIGSTASNNFVPATLTQGTGITITNGSNTITIANSALTSGDISLTSFSANNNQASAADVTGLAFSNGAIRSFEALVSVSVDATSDLFEQFKLYGIQRGSDWMLSQSATGDSSGFVFTITSSGQVQYTSGIYAGFVSATVKFRAIVLST